jgi:transcriptional regulator with XRE-family HTH domain
MRTLGERLTEERERLGSLRAAARALGVAPGTYESWEYGWRKPRRVAEFEKIEKFLGVERPVTLFWGDMLSEEATLKLLGSKAKGVYASSARSMVPAA